MSRVVQQVALAISGRGGRGRSAIYRWLWDRYPELSSEGNVSGRPDYVTATAAMKKARVGGKDAKSLNPDNVRKTWGRVVSDVEKYGYSRLDPIPEQLRRKARARPALPGEAGYETAPIEPPERSGGGSMASLEQSPRRRVRKTATFLGMEGSDGDKTARRDDSDR